VGVDGVEVGATWLIYAAFVGWLFFGRRSDARARSVLMMGEICRAVLAEFAPRTVDGPELELDAPVPRWAVADSGGVAQILRILLDNAVRFSPRDKTVAVHLGVEHAAPALSVRDDGTGVPEEDAEVIF
jgi:signal transduction histidine kinase